jgi:hypothetical protein
MSEELLNLPVGALLQLQAADDPEGPRHQVRFIGFFPGGSLIVRSPETNGKPVFVRAGQTFNVRMLRGDSVMGFAVPVLLVASKPYPHLHLACPKEVNRIVVRNARRVAADILATVRNLDKGPDGDFLTATVIDLSMTGVKITSDMPLGDLGDTLQLGFEVGVVGKPEKISALGVIRNTGTRVGPAGLEEIVYGLQFNALNRFQQVLLHGWVLERATGEEHLA